MEMGWTHCEGDHDIRRKRDEEYNLYSHCAHHNDDLLYCHFLFCAHHNDDILIVTKDPQGRQGTRAEIQPKITLEVVKILGCRHRAKTENTSSGRPRALTRSPIGAAQTSGRAVSGNVSHPWSRILFVAPLMVRKWGDCPRRWGGSLT